MKGFYEHSKSAGNTIMGKNTYIETSKYGYFPFPDALNIVVSNQEIENKWGDNVLITKKSPKDILNLLETKNFKTAFVAGGGQLNSSFLKENLIDEIYLDVEPLIFGKGIKVFSEADFEYDLKLMEVNKLNEDTIQLHYKILK
ncbi:MAG: dihydrofolate reductase [Minisyncoccia bacterium]